MTAVHPAAAVDHATSDRADKLARLRAILDERGADSIVLTSVEMLTWLLDGARVHVATNGAAVLAAEVGRSDERVVCASNETERLAAEELPADLTVAEVPWFEAPASALSTPDGSQVLAEADVADALRSARGGLLPLERSRYAALCRDVALILTDRLATAEPSDREVDLAGWLARDLITIGAEPLVILVGGSDRLSLRHPIPTDARVGDRVMAVVCARRHGMIANATRWRCFTPAAYRNQLARTGPVLDIESAILSGTRPGADLSDVFAIATTAYADHGFPDEWTRHHQGGPTGYLGRDPKASEATSVRIAPHQAFAWNPTVPGAKVEDTVVTGSGADDEPTILTVDPAWPTVVVAGRARPDVLQG